MEVQSYGRKDFVVQAVQVTRKNMREVAEWCSGRIETMEVKREGSDQVRRVKFIRVDAIRPLNEKHTQAFTTDWVVLSTSGLKVYTDHAFRNSFELREGHVNVFEKHGDPEPEPEVPDKGEKSMEISTITITEPPPTTSQRLGFDPRGPNLMKQ